MLIRTALSVSALRSMVEGLPTRSVGRAFVPELVFPAPMEAPLVGVAFGALDDEARSGWIDALTANALVIQVIAMPPRGTRRLFAWVTQRASDAMPIDEACTGLFAAGVRELCVYEVEGRRHLRAILGRRVA